MSTVVERGRLRFAPSPPPPARPSPITASRAAQPAGRWASLMCRPSTGCGAPVDHSRIGCKLMGETYTMRNSAGIDDHPPACADSLVVARSRPDVVLVYFGARPNDAAKMDGEYERACDRRYDEAWRTALSDRLVELSDGGRLPVVVATIPPSGRYAQPFEDADERIACVNEVTSEVVT